MKWKNDRSAREPDGVPDDFTVEYDDDFGTPQDGEVYREQPDYGDNGYQDSYNDGYGRGMTTVIRIMAVIPAATMTVMTMAMTTVTGIRMMATAMITAATATATVTTMGMGTMTVIRTAAMTMDTTTVSGRSRNRWNSMHRLKSGKSMGEMGIPTRRHAKRKSADVY